ncbi:non-ribosomal peptide synthetase [Streptomyces sp. NPDC059076]|uniref:non-ribosomal peptide synthetase n=1 Tax=unclassified Streptomyces TaxID=2593676 RepID=UPI00367D4E51
MTATSITAGYLARFADVAATEAHLQLLPLTGAQRRFTITSRAHRPEGRVDVVPLFFRFPAGTVDTDRLRGAAEYLAAVHPALRLRRVMLRGIPVSLLGAPTAVVRRIAPHSAEPMADALRRAIDEERQTTPLRLYVGSGAEFDDLAVVLEHTACDEQSLGRISAELAVAYTEWRTATDVSRPGVADEVHAYRKAVRLQLAREEAASDAASLSHWAGRLAGVDRSTAPVKPSTPAPPGSAVSGAVDTRLPALSAGGRGTAFPVLLDACAAAGRALYGSDLPPLLGYPWGGRPHSAPAVIGCFLNTVAHLGTEGTSADDWWDDLDHADTPFDEVVRAVRAAGRTWHGELDGMVTIEDLTRRPPLQLGDVVGREFHVPKPPTQAPFAVSFSQGSDLLVRMVWRMDLFSESRAEAAFSHLTHHLRTPSELTQGRGCRPKTGAA